MNNNDVIEIVKSSNIPEEAMLYVLSAVATCNNRKWEFDREFREKILASMPIGKRPPDSPPQASASSLTRAT